MTSIRLRRIIAAAALLFAAGVSAFAQSGAYSGYTPYSIFGIGDIEDQGSAYNMTMGGVGIASRNNRYINMLNPAAVTARDSLSFMADLSLYQSNKIITQGGKMSANNIFNIKDIAISFPLFGTNSAMMLGITPYATSGYSYSMYLDPEDYETAKLISQTGDISSTASGQGSIYQVFASAGVTLWNKLSLGVQGMHYFGNITKEFLPRSFTSASYSSVKSEYDIVLNGNSAKFGLQYEQPLGQNYTLGFGATYQLESRIKGYVSDIRYSSGATRDTLRYRTDTLGVNTDRLRLASEIGVGVSIKNDQKWRAEFNYTFSDWSSSNMASMTGFAVSGKGFAFSTTKAQAFRAGFEYIPNANDVRYFYRRIAYRAGIFYKESYFAMNNIPMTTAGLSLGFTMPVFRLSNGLTFGMELGRRGMNIDNAIKETYVNFSIGINTYDIWFQKSFYQ